jgi:hypothetical protein
MVILVIVIIMVPMFLTVVSIFISQWLIAQLVERSLSVMKDPGSNLDMDICSFCY